MPDAFKKTSDIKQIPLFPLPLVLFPNELLPLHIFEPRYRQMLSDIQIGDNLFGLSYFNQDVSDSLLPEKGSLGCIAEVREVQTLEDGRSNILTVGIVRYELDGYIESDTPYLMGEISVFEDFEEDERELNAIADDVFALFKRVAQAAHDVSGMLGNLPEIQQSDPQTLSFLISAAFNLDTGTKFELIKMRSTIQRLERLQSVLKDAVIRAEETAEVNKVARTNGHSHKKIDLDGI